MSCSFKTYLIDWELLRALHTPLVSNESSIVKEVKIGQSAAKLLYKKNVQRLSRKGVGLRNKFETVGVLTFLICILAY
jgi:hypothetical protein